MGEPRIITNFELLSFGPVFDPPHPSWRIDKVEYSERGPARMFETTQYVRKPFNIDAVQITSTNMEDVALWVDGSVLEDDAGKPYIKVDVKRPFNERQTRAYVGDWVLAAGTGYKVYNDKAFKKSFEQTGNGTTMVDPRKKTKKRDEGATEVVGVVEGDVVVPKRVPKKTTAKVAS